jgi:MFS family permease
VIFFLFAILWGIGFGGTMPPYALFVQDYYGLKSFGAIYGGIMVLASLGMASGGYVGGLLFDLSGSYQPAWVLSLGAGLFTGILALHLAPPLHPRQGRHVEKYPGPRGAPAKAAV